MIKRIVKMTFSPEKIDDFLQVFEASKHHIRAFAGCQHLELWQNASEANVLFTFSFWESEVHLEQYRQSNLFAETWAETKILFAEKPQAWTIKVIEILPE
ncbi:MAG: antibiotic biosynthesis monooxygenase [Saprospiraceae bacterium]|nr:antibiotic biosynthesis monooxygenase [Saprospiraceae bacterium]